MDNFKISSFVITLSSLLLAVFGNPDYVIPISGNRPDICVDKNQCIPSFQVQDSINDSAASQIASSIRTVTPSNAITTYLMPYSPASRKKILNAYQSQFTVQFENTARLSVEEGLFLDGMLMSPEEFYVNELAIALTTYDIPTVIEILFANNISIVDGIYKLYQKDRIGPPFSYKVEWAVGIGTREYSQQLVSEQLHKKDYKDFICRRFRVNPEIIATIDMEFDAISRDPRGSKWVMTFKRAIIDYQPDQIKKLIEYIVRNDPDYVNKTPRQYLSHMANGTVCKEMLDTWVTIWEISLDPIKYFANRILDSVSSPTNFLKTVKRIFIARSQVDLRSILTAFQKLTAEGKDKRSIEDYIKDRTRGNYTDLLLAFVSGTFTKPTLAPNNSPGTGISTAIRQGSPQNEMGSAMPTYGQSPNGVMPPTSGTANKFVQSPTATENIVYNPNTFGNNQSSTVINYDSFRPDQLPHVGNANGPANPPALPPSYKPGSNPVAPWPPQATVSPLPPQVILPSPQATLPPPQASVLSPRAGVQPPSGQIMPRWTVSTDDSTGLPNYGRNNHESSPLTLPVTNHVQPADFNAGPASGPRVQPSVAFHTPQTEYSSTNQVQPADFNATSGPRVLPKVDFQAPQTQQPSTNRFQHSDSNAGAASAPRNWPAVSIQAPQTEQQPDRQSMLGKQLHDLPYPEEPDNSAPPSPSYHPVSGPAPPLKSALKPQSTGVTTSGVIGPKTDRRVTWAD